MSGSPSIGASAKLKEQYEQELKSAAIPVARKQAVELGDLETRDKRKLSQLSRKDKIAIRGAGCKKLIEPVPKFIKAGCEKVIKGTNNNFIVLGRDRPSSRLTGYGGKGHTKAGMVDIVVGRLGSNSPYKDGTKLISSDPDFSKDSARIYLSQRTDIDENFKLVPSPGALESTARSAIGIKADAVRIVGRENIRLVTLTNVENSMGGLVQSIGGIDLVAGNFDKNIQPMVKGKNLIKCLEDLVDHVDDLRSIIVGFVDLQNKFNLRIMDHTHHSPFFGAITSKSPVLMEAGIKTAVKTFSKTIVSTKLMAFNFESFKKNYLNPGVSDPIGPDTYICSRYNNVN
jgi:hypothetical protein